LPVRPLVAIPDQSEPKNLSMLGFRGAPMLGRPYPQTANNILIQIAHRKRRHRNPCAVKRINDGIGVLRSM
jgi:hypothetical protein